MMDKIMTDSQMAYVFPYSGTGHDKHYGFYDKIFRLLNIGRYNYYGELRSLSEMNAETAQICFYCVPDVWINGNIEPNIEFNVPFYGDNAVFPELLTPCLNTGIMLPPGFSDLANTEPDTVYDYDFPCVTYNGQLSSSVHKIPFIDSMQIEHVLYIKKYNKGVPVYAAMQNGDFLPLLKTKLQNGFTHICVYMDGGRPKDASLPYYGLGGGYYILFLPTNMDCDGIGYVIPSVGLGEITINATHVVQNGDALEFR